MTTNDHITPIKRYFSVLLLLFSLTGVTVFASTIDMGGFNIWLTLLIAASKATLVLLYFMHLKEERAFIKLTFIGTVTILAIFIGFTFWDIAFR